MQHEERAIMQCKFVLSSHTEDEDLHFRGISMKYYAAPGAKSTQNTYSCEKSLESVGLRVYDSLMRHVARRR